MAVKEESLHHKTDALILSKPRPYYRASIYTSHWQLRSLIGSPEQNVIYYPSGFDIYALYPKTKEREIVTTLPFSPRCLTVAGNWLCCGGRHGDFTAISLSDKKTDTDFMNLDPDARLPLDLDPSRRSSPRDTPSGSRRSRGRTYPLQASVKRVGAEADEKEDAINNCITLWFPPRTASERTYKIPVAVVANNDKSVYIVNLPDSDVLEKLTYPDCVNRALMSPDGELLVAVLDDPFLYVHQRKEKAASSSGGLHSKQQYAWVGVCRIQLDGQSQADKTTMKGSFALSFSNSGKYLSVATQYGVISVFDVETLTQEHTEPLSIFTSSRPGRHTGAIREMQFSPGPFDLLAWTESSGRVGVADLRNLFLSRQLLMVDCRQDGIEKIGITERAGEPAIDPRLRIFRTDSPASTSTTPDYLGLDLERRQLRSLTRDMSDRHQSSLTSEELEVLQAHRIARRQRDAAAEITGSGPSGWGPWAPGQRPTSTSAVTTNGETRTSADRRISTTGLPAALREFVDPERTAASFRSFINERNQDRERRSQQQEPRRRSSIILAATERAIEQETLGTGSSRTDNDTPAGVGRLTLTPLRTASRSPNNPWAEIDALYRTRYPADPPADRTTHLRIELEEDDRQGFANRLRRPFGDLGLGARDDSRNVIIRGAGRRNNEDDEQPPETMGLCWSPDGRFLYIGAEDGIYEYHVNISQRKKFPSLVLR